MRRLWSRVPNSSPLILLAIALFSAFYFMVSSAAGGIYTFSPVPFWDMWNHYLDFYLRLNDADWSVWFRQNNEHRIVLSRILFWLDFKLFGGGVYFLIVCNYLLALLAAVMFAVVLKSGVDAGSLSRINLVLIAAVTALCFSWLQVENFSWGYQSQFFLAQSLPLIALYLLYRSSQSSASDNRVFYLAAACGVVCAGAMANGILALPCMTIVALFANFGRRRVAVLLLLSVAVAALYFYDYHAPKRHDVPLLKLEDQAADVLWFMLTYLGAPFFHIFHGSLFAAQLAGAALVVASSLVAVCAVVAKERNALVLSLLGYLAYLFVSALITASGRVSFGIEYALSSRYATAALMAWCVFFVIVAIRYQHVSWIEKSTAVSALALVLALAPVQTRAFQSYHEDRFERLIAAMALEIGVKDDLQIRKIYFNPAKALRLTDGARRLGVSVFAAPLFSGTREQIGRPVSREAIPRCLGALENVTPVVTDPRYLKISGWLYQPDLDAVPSRIVIADATRVVVGAALSGQKRADVARSVHGSTKLLGFKGYIRAEAQQSELVLTGEFPACELAISRQLPAS